MGKLLILVRFFYTIRDLVVRTIVRRRFPCVVLMPGVLLLIVLGLCLREPLCLLRLPATALHLQRYLRRQIPFHHFGVHQRNLPDHAVLNPLWLCKIHHWNDLKCLIVFGFFGFGGIHHDTVGLEIGASDSSAELMQLGQSETLCILDQHDRGIRDIDSDFDYGSGN